MGRSLTRPMDWMTSGSAARSKRCTTRWRTMLNVRPARSWTLPLGRLMRSPFAATLLALTIVMGPSIAAQETPTQREAAKDVLSKMDALERSLDVAGLVARLTGPNAARDQVTNRTKELMDTELLALSDDITRNPEHGFVEFKSVDKLTAYLKKHDFSVTMGVAGMKTAFVATYNKGKGAPNLGVIVEYDALRGTKGDFHGDQHSAQGPIGLAAAVAMAEYLTSAKLPGSVTVYGAPGEEMAPPDAKTDMYKAGVFAGADILLRSHGTSTTTRPAPGFGTCCMNIVGAKYTFNGAPAHQMTAWNGRNALTAVVHLFVNIDGIRIHPGFVRSDLGTTCAASTCDKAQCDLEDPQYSTDCNPCLASGSFQANKMHDVAVAHLSRPVTGITPSKVLLRIGTASAALGRYPLNLTQLIGKDVVDGPNEPAQRRQRLVPCLRRDGGAANGLRDFRAELCPRWRRLLRSGAS